MALIVNSGLVEPIVQAAVTFQILGSGVQCSMIVGARLSLGIIIIQRGLWIPGRIVDAIGVGLTPAILCLL